MERTIYWEDGAVMILDQVKLPLEVEYIRCTDHHMVARCIMEMNIRGAPAIGIATAMGIAVAASRMKETSAGGMCRALEAVYDELLATRPTAVNIRWAVDRVRGFLEGLGDIPVPQLKQDLVAEAVRVLEEDVAVNRAIGEHGAGFIPEGARVLTHCNAGALATGGYGTATAPMRVAHEKGKKIHVYADETRPLLQGARLTAWELMRSGIPVTLIADNAAGALMSMGEIDLVIVGTDRTTYGGDVANKIGTYTVAVLAKEHGIPFYVAAPTSSIDFTMEHGEDIPIEERSPEEVTDIMGRCRVAPDGVLVRNPAFDVTPSALVTAIITEKGAFRPGDLHRLRDVGADLERYVLRGDH